MNWRMIALLKEVQPGQDVALVVALAILEFVRREEQRPTWVQAGADITLPAGCARMYGLQRAGTCDRPECIRIGRGEYETLPLCCKCGTTPRLPGGVHCYDCGQQERRLAESAR